MQNSKDIQVSLISSGIAMSLIFSIFVNIGMTIGVVPIFGITLPFVSYGGSYLLANFTTIGLILNIGMRRNNLVF